MFGTSAAGDPLNSRILILEIETGDVRELVASGNQPRYVSTGHLIYGHGDGALMGVPFDVETLQVTGAPVTLLPSLAVFGGGASQFGVSNNGTLIYATAAEVDSGATGRSPLMWVDMEGNETPLPLRQAGATIPRLSPEGSRIAYGSDGQIWVYDIATGTNTQLTFEGTSRGPIWSPDGLFVYFMSVRPGTDGPDLFRKAADGASEAEQLWRRGGGERTLTSIARDGSWLVVGEVNTGDADVALAFLGADSVSSRDYLGADWVEAEAALSPNGRWMAYTSGERGGRQVFVRGFPEPIGQWRLSEANNAFDPVWAPDGSALYYVAPPNLMKVDVSTEGTFSHGQPTVLFPWLYNSGGGLDTGYAIHPDGDRFLFAGGAGGGPWLYNSGGGLDTGYAIHPDRPATGFLLRRCGIVLRRRNFRRCLTGSRSFASGWGIEGSDPLASRLRGRRGDRLELTASNPVPAVVARTSSAGHRPQCAPSRAPHRAWAG